MSTKYLRPSTVLGVCSLSALAIAAGCSGAGDETLGTARSADVISSDLVISQVYGGGQGNGASYKYDFVELFNRGAQPVELGDKTVQYASATGKFASNNIALPNFTLAPGKYFLIRLAGADSGDGAPLPAADHTASQAVSQTAGKVALVLSANLLTCGEAASQCTNGGWIDFVGFGTTASQAEGTKTPSLSVTTAAVRKNGGCTDTGNNLDDFEITAATPRNSASTANVCSCP